jgi:hypothetical protein
MTGYDKPQPPRRIVFVSEEERNAFWAAWHADKERMKASGYKVRRYNGQWEIWFYDARWSAPVHRFEQRPAPGPALVMSGGDAARRPRKHALLR